MDATVREHNRYDGGSLMMWGGISLGYRILLHHVDSILNGFRYRDEVLRPIALPTLMNLCPDAIFQNDNAHAHRTRLLNDLLVQQ